MKRIVVILVFLLIGVTAGAVIISINTVSAFAQEKNHEKTLLVQKRLDETLSLLLTLSRDAYICDSDVSYQEKAMFLTNKNREEALGYMMLRILDGDINIYREDTGLASNLRSRDYMQKLYSTGEQQVTDAFLAGADGTTINYTVTAAISEGGRVTGALMAAIYGSEVDEYLQDDDSKNVLIGSELQYMGGITKEQFGLAVAQVLGTGQNTSRPLENILLDFHDEKSGSFWSIGGGIRYFAYSPIAHADWVVMTEVRVLPMISTVLIVYCCIAVALIIVAVFLGRRKKPD